MSLLLAITGWDNAQAWLTTARQQAGTRPVHLWPDVPDLSAITYLCAWKAPSEIWQHLPNLKVIFSLGAGVDHLLNDPALPDLPIVRVAEPDLTMRMSEYVVLHVLWHHRQMQTYQAQQRARLWQDHPQSVAHEMTVGIMGLGVLGQDAARKLQMLGFQVTGWSRTARSLAGVTTYAGQAGMADFLKTLDILVVLLPLTENTRGLLNKDLFRRLNKGTVLINAGRGGLQVEADILSALDDGTLKAASLDVFATEPLPAEHPIWAHPNVLLTPHNAAVSTPHSTMRHVLAQIARFESGQSLQVTVDRKSGY